MMAAKSTLDSRSDATDAIVVRDIAQSTIPYATVAIKPPATACSPPARSAARPARPRIEIVVRAIGNEPNTKDQPI